jgi:hypothetical protein
LSVWIPLLSYGKVSPYSVKSHCQIEGGVIPGLNRNQGGTFRYAPLANNLRNHFRAVAGGMMIGPFVVRVVLVAELNGFEDRESVVYIMETRE